MTLYKYEQESEVANVSGFSSIHVGDKFSLSAIFDFGPDQNPAENIYFGNADLSQPVNLSIGGYTGTANEMQIAVVNDSGTVDAIAIRLGDFNFVVDGQSIDTGGSGFTSISENPLLNADPATAFHLTSTFNIKNGTLFSGTSNSISFDVIETDFSNTSPVPESSALSLLLVGGAALAAFRARQKRKNAPSHDSGPSL